jgi:hypothetical protein
MTFGAAVNRGSKVQPRLGGVLAREYHVIIFANATARFMPDTFGRTRSS